MDHSILIYQVGGRNKFRIQFQRNTGATPPIGGGGAPTGTPSTPPSSSVTPPASGTGQSGNTPPSQSGPAATPPGSTPGTQPDDPTERNWQQLRSKSEAAQARAALLDKLGAPAGQEEKYLGAFGKVLTEANSLVKELGYDEADFLAAFEQDPFKTLEILRADKAAARPNPPQQVNETREQYESRLKEMVKEATQPFTDHINQQISTATLEKVNSTMTATIAASLPDVPPEVNSLVTDYVSEYLASQPGILAQMKKDGVMTPVEDTVKFVAGRLKDVFTKWTAHEMSRTRGGRPATASPTAPVSGQQGKRPSLDDIINDPGVLGSQYR